jgi:hypothetical protein
MRQNWPSSYIFESYDQILHFALTPETACATGLGASPLLVYAIAFRRTHWRQHFAAAHRN